MVLKEELVKLMKVKWKVKLIFGNSYFIIFFEEYIKRYGLVKIFLFVLMFEFLSNRVVKYIWWVWCLYFYVFLNSVL